jgi:hypothetical protein
MVRWVRVILHRPRLEVRWLKMDRLSVGRHFLLKMAAKRWKRLLMADNWMMLRVHRFVCWVILS